MTTPYIGEIRMFGGDFAPQDWALCNGALQSIEENTTLFTLIGTTYGGDGTNTFALPDLQSRVPMHQGAGYVIGQRAGTESVQVITSQLPSHSHLATGTSDGGTSTDPTLGVWASTP